MPGNISDIYQNNFKRMFPSSNDDDENDENNQDEKEDDEFAVVKNYIAMIIVAEEPLKVSFLKSTLKVNENEFKNIRDKTSLLFPCREDNRIHGKLFSYQLP